jgi:hypothetical protein
MVLRAAGNLIENRRKDVETSLDAARTSARATLNQRFFLSHDRNEVLVTRRFSGPYYLPALPLIT